MEFPSTGIEACFLLNVFNHQPEFKLDSNGPIQLGIEGIDLGIDQRLGIGEDPIHSNMMIQSLFIKVEDSRLYRGGNNFSELSFVSVPDTS